MKRTLMLTALAASFFAGARTTQTLTEGWEFARPGEAWQQVRVPHDWAIYGPFDINNDLQTVAVEQNGERVATQKTGRTGGLPFIGSGSYRLNLEIPEDTLSRTLVFDGAMSNARVFVNGTEVMYWPYGYNSFYVGIDSVVQPGTNLIEVLCENMEKQSRWYPGAGLYRNVHLVTTNPVHVDVWGSYVTTTLHDGAAGVHLQFDVKGLAENEKVHLITDIRNAAGETVATKSSLYVFRGQPATQNLLIPAAKLWSPETPYLYTATTRIERDGVELDSYDTRFGVRTIEYIPQRGFFLNGEPVKFRGVCNHHDLGPLGAAVNRSALRHQISLLKDMGCNAIRTSHNMPAPELVELCDEMGMMLMIEPFDDWGFRPKSANGYGRYFNEWAERDITNMVRHYRNSPAVVMWSVGNEVPSQWGPPGMGELMFLQDLVHQLDPTRPVTCGMDQIRAVLDNGFAAALDIPGFNYKPQHYERAYDILPQQMILGSETASTVSSRGVYHFPVEYLGKRNIEHPDHQSTGYDLEHCSWSNLPEEDFAADDDKEYVMGQFVWTGFDYLGEPSPYDTDAWPNHSSVFGIIDLASLPKDRFYLYRSQWNKQEPTLHILPHWNWKGREGEVTPVFVYTSYPKAELFVNGVSQGLRQKGDTIGQPVGADKLGGLLGRYRLMWNDVRYQPGELRVVAYDNDGNAVAEETVRTAGRPHHLVATLASAPAEEVGDLAYVTITVEDRDGNPVPVDSRMVSFTVEGAGEFEAAANGDPTCLLPFQQPRMQLFSGACTAIVRRTGEGPITLRARAPHVAQAVAGL